MRQETEYEMFYDRSICQHFSFLCNSFSYIDDYDDDDDNDDNNDGFVWEVRKQTISDVFTKADF